MLSANTTNNVAIELRQPLQNLMQEYQSNVKKCEEFAQVIKGSTHSFALSIFESALAQHKDYSRFAGLMDVSLAEAVKELDVRYWTRAFRQFKFDELMSADDRNLWTKMLHMREVPPFTEQHVIPTMENFYLGIGELTAKKIDGIFRRLSRDHLTNTPEGFYKRMIFHIYWSYTTQEEAIADLLMVCAQILGRGMDLSEARSIAYFICKKQINDGQWRWYAGNILKARRYMKGTVHIEVHPDVAWRLNQQLASYGMNKNAIPSEFCRAPTRKSKAPELVNAYLQPEQLQALTLCEFFDDGKLVKYHVSHSKHAIILALLGGVLHSYENQIYAFDYDVRELIAEILYK